MNGVGGASARVFGIGAGVHGAGASVYGARSAGDVVDHFCSGTSGGDSGGNVGGTDNGGSGTEVGSGFGHTQASSNSNSNSSSGTALPRGIWAGARKNKRGQLVLFRPRDPPSDPTRQALRGRPLHETNARRAARPIRTRTEVGGYRRPYQAWGSSASCWSTVRYSDGKNEGGVHNRDGAGMRAFRASGRRDLERPLVPTAAGPFVWGEHSTIPGKREAAERLTARSAVLRAFELETPPWQREAKREPCEWGDECSDSDCELEHPSDGADVGSAGTAMKRGRNTGKQRRLRAQMPLRSNYKYAGRKGGGSGNQVLHRDKRIGFLRAVTKT